MLKQAFLKILNFIKEYLILLVFLLIIIIVSFVKLPYSIMMPGGSTNLNERYIITDGYKAKGSMNLAYVSEIDANLLTFLVAKINPYWDIYKSDDTKLPKESSADSLKRMKLNLEESVDIAKIVALTKAGYKIDLNNSKILISYVMDKSKNNLLVNDEIVAINGQKIKDVGELQEFINNKNVGDTLDVLVIRNNSEKHCYAKVFKYENKLVIGVSTILKYDYESPVLIKYQGNKKEYGSSGGLMNALTIYNALTKEDLTKGKKIIGTGTIDIDGNIGEIDGIKYKLIGADRKKCDIFMVPVANYQEALKVKDKYHLKIKIVKVNTIDDAINYLKGM